MMIQSIILRKDEEDPCSEVINKEHEEERNHAVCDGLRNQKYELQPQ